VLQPVEDEFSRGQLRDLFPDVGTRSPGLTATSTRGGGRRTCACSGAAPTSRRERRGPGTS
jgi:hypothetical protein